MKPGSIIVEGTWGDNLARRISNFLARIALMLDNAGAGGLTIKDNLRGRQVFLENVRDWGTVPLRIDCPKKPRAVVILSMTQAAPAAGAAALSWTCPPVTWSWLDSPAGGVVTINVGTADTGSMTFDIWIVEA